MDCNLKKKWPIFFKFRPVNVRETANLIDHSLFFPGKVALDSSPTMIVSKLRAKQYVLGFDNLREYRGSLLVVIHVTQFETKNMLKKEKLLSSP